MDLLNNQVGMDTNQLKKRSQMRRCQLCSKRNLTLFFLLILLFSAFLIRHRGIKFGFPLITHPDEPKIVKRAIRIIKTGDLNPHFFNYPSLYIYMQAAIYSTSGFFGKTFLGYKDISDFEMTTIYYLGRLFTIFFSIGTLFIVYLIGKYLFSEAAGLISALFISFSFLHVTHSYSVTVNSPMVFWVMLSFLMSVFIFTKGPKMKYYILNGIFIGFAIGTKYTAFPAFFPMLYAHFYSSSFSIKAIFNKKLIIAALLVLIAFFISTPYSLLDFDKFYHDIKHESRHYSTGHIGSESKTTSYFHYTLTLLYEFGVIPLIISLCGILYLLIKNKKKAFFLLCFPILYFGFIGVYKVYFSRNIIALVPFLSLFSGFLISQIYYSIKCEPKAPIKKNSFYHIFTTKKTYFIIIFVILACLSMYGIHNQYLKSVRYIKKITLPDTRWISTQWIEENIPRGSKIALEFYTPRPDKKHFKIFYLGHRGLGMKRNLKKFDFLVASSGDYARFFKNKKKYAKKVNIYNNIFERYKLIKIFKPNGVDTTGPVIKIFKVN